MRRSHVALLIVCILCVTISGISLYTSVGPNLVLGLPDFYWGTQVNQTLLYAVTVYGYQEGGLSWGDYDEILALDETRVIATITSLPNLSSVVDSVSFENSVIERNKVSCAFENGSNISPGRNQDIVRAISGSILPLGSWTHIESYFINESPGWIYGETFVVTKLREDYFFIGWEWWGDYDAAGGWNGEVRLTDGIPTQVIWYYTHVDTVYIELNLIE